MRSFLIVSVHSFLIVSVHSLLIVSVLSLLIVSVLSLLIVSVHSLLLFLCAFLFSLINLESINQMEWSAIAACPRLLCLFL